MTKVEHDKLFRSENLAVSYLRKKSDTIIISFDCWTETPSLDAECWGQSAIEKLDCSGIFFKCSANRWWQYEETMEALRKAHEICLKYKKVITYGTSMGAYATIRFSGPLGSMQTIAISPQYSIDPSKVPFEDRWNEDLTYIESFRESRINHSGKIFIIYDPGDLKDRAHVDLIKCEAPVEEIKLRNASHAAPNTLNQMKILKEILKLAVYDTFDASIIRDLYKKNRALSCNYFRNLSTRGLNRHRKLMCLRRAEELEPNDSEVIAYIGDFFMQEGLLDQAKPYYSKALSLNPENAWLAARLSNLEFSIAKIGLMKSLSIAELAVKNAPNFPWFHHQIGEIYESVGNYHDAKLSYARAIYIDPRNSTFTAALERIRNTL